MGSWEMPGISGSAFDSQGSAALPKGNMSERWVSVFPIFLFHLPSHDK